MKTCNTCGNTKPQDEFYTTCSECKECRKARSKCRHEAKRDEIREKSKEYRTAHAAEIKAKAAEWRAAPGHKAQMQAYQEEWYQRNRDEVRARSAQWKRDNPDKVLAHYNSRRAKVRSAFVEQIDHQELAERDGWICGICLGHVSREEWSLDHIQPLNKGGEHAWYNVQLAHKRCNSRKRDRTDVVTRSPIMAVFVQAWPPQDWDVEDEDGEPLEANFDHEAFARGQEEIMRLVWA